MSIFAKEREALNALLNFCELEQERHHVSMSLFFEDLFAVYHDFKSLNTSELVVESSYTGVHLSESYYEKEFLHLVEQFKNSKTLHIKYALQLVRDSLNKMKHLPNVCECDMRKSNLNGCVIVGDLHGSFSDLYFIIKKYGIPGKNYFFIFNGDFVDRGSKQCEVILTLLYAFLLNSSTVFLNRGNHEDLGMNLSTNFSPNFSADCLLKYSDYGNELFKQLQLVFRYLPLATVLINKTGFKCFVVHGGISDKTDLKYVRNEIRRAEFGSISVQRSNDKSYEQLSDLLWSDPYQGKHCVPNNLRGLGCLFDDITSKEFCLKNGFNALVRSHEVRESGYSRDNLYCFTVFSSSNYCHGHNYAAVLVLHQNKKSFHIQQMKTNDISEDSFQKQRDYLLKTFKAYLSMEYEYLIKKFQSYDVRNTGKF